MSKPVTDIESPPNYPAYQYPSPEPADESGVPESRGIDRQSVKKNEIKAPGDISEHHLNVRHAFIHCLNHIHAVLLLIITD